MKIEVCRFILMCLSAFLWCGCGYMAAQKVECKEEVLATALVAFMFGFWATFG